MDPKVKPVQPKTGQTHGIFGVRQINMHRMREPKWTPYDKFNQYTVLTTLHEKDKNLSSMKEKADLVKNVHFVRSMRHDIHESRQKLKIAVYGDVQRVKNILQNHKTLQRLYSHMPAHLMVENIDQRTFVKRKELDRLISKKNQLAKIYADSSLELALLQDRIKYVDVLELENDTTSKKLRMELKNTETQLRAMNNINTSYKQIIKTLMQDSLYFEPVLRALQEDIGEQHDFISTIIRLGLPALKNLEQLTHEYNELERKTRTDIRSRMATIREYQNKIQYNSATMKELVRKFEDFNSYHNRYDRETASMTDLNNQFLAIEKDMKLIQKITSSEEPGEVYYRITNVDKENTSILTNVKNMEFERHALLKRVRHADVIQQSLRHNLTDAQVEQANEIERTEQNIVVNVKQQEEIKMEITKTNEKIELFILSFQHIANVVRHVGQPHMATQKSYSNIDLNLPLLKFNDDSPKVKRSAPVEEDPSLLLDIIKDRINMLMDNYPVEDNPIEIKAAEKFYHNAVVEDLCFLESVAQAEADAPLLELAVAEDPKVPTRKQIKFYSKKIVDANAKTEDEA